MQGNRTVVAVKAVAAAGVLSMLASMVFVSAPAMASGFIKLSDHIKGRVKLETCLNRKESYCHTEPGANMAKYTRVAFKPIEFRLHPNSEYQGVDPAGFKLVSDMFHQTLIGQLEPEYRVVNYVNPQTLAVHVSLVDIKLKKTGPVRHDQALGGLGISAAQDKVSKIFQMSEAVFETEFLDGDKGQRLAVLVDRNLYENPASTEPWETMRQVFKNYAQRIKARLDQANNR